MEGECESLWLGSFTVAGGRCADGFMGVGAADEVDLVLSLSGPSWESARIGVALGAVHRVSEGVPSWCRKPVS